MIDFDADMDTMLNEDEHARPAVFTHTGVAAKTISVIFDKQYSAPEGVGLVAVSSSAPAATCKTSDVSNASRGDTLTLDVDGVSTTYKVTVPEHDGTGMSVLFLSED